MGRSHPHLAETVRLPPGYKRRERNRENLRFPVDIFIPGDEPGG
jgi:hypothetical protein